MLESWPVSLLTGTVLGFLSGLGIGGGSLLILWLTVVLGVDHNTARGINLLFFLPTAAIAIIYRQKQGTVEIKTLLPAILAGTIAAAAFSKIGLKMDMSLLKKLFGGLLMITGVRELFYRPRQ